MSGGFFRGTSAEQDTRFSNKQAKLLKSQKFAPELEHLVDMTKVKMDVIRPWIATKVTELLGFEDEVLINFIYGLLDGKEVNGKQVQISLTGFMEKNTGKFMKELWTLLLSAERNASGVPQQFLDAKEEETRKNKAESERIASEIQKKRDKDSREPEHERLRKMEDGDEQKAGDMELEPSSKNMPPKGSSGRSEDERSADQRNGVRRKRASRSPRSIYRSPSPRGSHSRSVSRSYSNSRSYSGDKKKSRSVSRSPRPRRRSISSEKVRPSPRRRSLTPRSRRSPYSSRSPVRRRSSYSRRRSRSLSARRSPSPMRRRLRSPYRRRSRSPIRRRRSPSPIRHHNRSPLSNRRRRRSPSPVQGRRYTSPVRRSPSPGRRRFPSPRRRRSPLRVRRRSPSPSPVRQQHRRSSSPPRHSSSSLVQHRSPASSRRSISPSPGRSLSPSTSPSPVQHRFSSPVRRSTKEQRRSPGERQGMNRKSSPVGRMKSSDRDLVDRRDVGGKVPALSPSPNKSPVYKSPSRVRNRSTGEDRSPYESPVRPRREGIARVDSLSPVQKPRELKGQQDSKGTGRRNEASRSGRSPLVIKQRGSPRKDDTPERAGNQLDDKEFRKQDLQMKSKKSSGKRVDPGTPDRQRSPAFSEDSFQAEKQSAFCVSEGNKSEERVFSRQNHVEDGGQHHKAETSPMSYDNNHGLDSGSEGSERRTKHKEKRKHKRSERREVTSDDDSSYDSEIEGRKEAKRRRKEEKKLRKEEKRRRREERRRKKEGRRAEKLKMRGQDDDSSSDGGHGSRRKSHPSYDEVEETERKKLESELRKKALESLKAKKGISN